MFGFKKKVQPSLLENLEIEIEEIRKLEIEAKAKKTIIKRLETDFLATLNIKMTNDPAEIVPFFPESLTLGSRMKKILIEELSEEVECIVQKIQSLKEKLQTA